MSWIGTGISIATMLAQEASKPTVPVGELPQQQGLLGESQGVASMSPDDFVNQLSQLSADPNAGSLASATEGISIPTPTLPPVTDDKGGFLGGLNQFGEGLDKTLSSPSRQLGIGLLGEIDPRLMLAGLLGSGLLDSGLLGKQR